MLERLVRHHSVISIVGNIVTVDVPRLLERPSLGARLGDLAFIEDAGGAESLAQVVKMEGSRVLLQAFSGTQGISTSASVRFLGQPMRTA